MVEQRLTIVNSSIDGYFREVIHRSAKNQSFTFPEDTEEYVIELLVGGVDNIPKEKPYILAYADAVNSEKYEKNIKLKGIGDNCLFYTGLFSEHLTKNGIGIEYYATIGAVSYKELSEKILGDSLFIKLAKNLWLFKMSLRRFRTGQI